MVWACVIFFFLIWKDRIFFKIYFFSYLCGFECHWEAVEIKIKFSYLYIRIGLIYAPLPQKRKQKKDNKMNSGSSNWLVLDPYL